MNCKETKNQSQVELTPIHEALVKAALDAAIKVHRELGPGLLESAYRDCLSYELSQANINIEREKTIPLTYGELTLETGFRADLILEGKVLLELKAVETLLPIHLAQTITYLKLAKLPIGLLLNFNVRLLKEGTKRVLHPALFPQTLVS